MITPNVPLVDLKAQYRAHREAIDAAMARVVQSTAFILGAEAEAFERAFAELCGVERAVGCGSGTDAITLALRGLGVGVGDHVIVPSMTFFASSEAVERAGATPIFADVDPQTLLLTAETTRAAWTRQTRAVLPVHLYGQCADVSALKALADARGAVVVEDAAQAHGAGRDGWRVGALSDAACFSFYPGKNLGAYGDAGAVITRNPALADWIVQARNHGRASKYTHDFSGYSSRLDGLQAAVLGAKLPHLAAWTEARRRIAARYDEAFVGLPGLEPVGRVPGPGHVFHLYVLRVAGRDKVLAALRAQGVMAGVHYPVPLHMQPAYAARSIGADTLPHARIAADEVLSLPLYPELTKAQQARVIDALKAAIAMRDKQ